MCLASFCSRADRFESYLVANSEYRFSRDEAHTAFLFFYIHANCWTSWATTWQNRQIMCAPSENLDQPVCQKNNLSWLFDTDRNKTVPRNHCLPFNDHRTDFYIRTSHPWEIFIVWLARNKHPSGVKLRLHDTTLIYISWKMYHDISCSPH